MVDREAKKPDDWDDEEVWEWEALLKDYPAHMGDWYVREARLQFGVRGSLVS